MFKELMPVLKRRPITLTVSSLDGDLVRVNVVPHGLDEDKKVNDSIPYSSKEKVAKIPDEAIKGLTTALCLTGTAEEIDAGLVERLTSFTESHVQLQEVFDQAGKQIAEAVRAIKEREERDRKEKQKAKSKDAPVKASVETNAGPESNDPQKDSDPPAKEPLPQNLGLF